MYLQWYTFFTSSISKKYDACVCCFITLSCFNFFFLSISSLVFLSSHFSQGESEFEVEEGWATHTHTHTHTCVYTCPYMYMYIYIYIYAYVHTYTQVFFHQQLLHLAPRAQVRTTDSYYWHWQLPHASLSVRDSSHFSLL